MHVQTVTRLYYVLEKELGVSNVCYFAFSRALKISLHNIQYCNVRFIFPFVLSDVGQIHGAARKYMKLQTELKAESSLTCWRGQILEISLALIKIQLRREMLKFTCVPRYSHNKNKYKTRKVTFLNSNNTTPRTGSQECERIDIIELNLSQTGIEIVIISYNIHTSFKKGGY